MSTSTTTAWRVSGSVLAVITLAWLSLEAVDQVVGRQGTVTDRFDAATIERVEITLENGGVVIDGRPEASTATVIADVRSGLGSANYRASVSNGTLRIDTGCSWRSDSCVEQVRVVVPASVDVLVRVENDDIMVRGIGGEIDLATENGDVETSALTSPSVAASSQNGAVQLGFARPPRRATATSENGDVEVVLPASADNAAVDFVLVASSSNGDVTTPVRTNPSSARSITATSENGNVNVRYQP